LCGKNSGEKKPRGGHREAATKDFTGLTLGSPYVESSLLAASIAVNVLYPPLRILN